MTIFNLVFSVFNYFIDLKFGFYALFFKFINYFYFKSLIILFSCMHGRINYYLKIILIFKQIIFLFYS